MISVYQLELSKYRLSPTSFFKLVMITIYRDKKFMINIDYKWVKNFNNSF